MLYPSGHVTFRNKRIPHLGLDGDVRCTVCVYPVSDTVVGPRLVCPGPVEVDSPSRTLPKAIVLSKKTSGIYG